MILCGCNCFGLGLFSCILRIFLFFCIFGSYIFLSAVFLFYGSPFNGLVALLVTVLNRLMMMMKMMMLCTLFIAAVSDLSPV